MTPSLKVARDGGFVVRLRCRRPYPRGGWLSCGPLVSALWGYVLFHDSDGIQCTTLLAAIPVDL